LTTDPVAAVMAATTPGAMDAQRPGRFTDQHFQRLEAICQGGSPPPPDPRQRGSARQTLRELEQSIRLGVLDFCQQAAAQGAARQQLAAHLTLAPRTLRHWQQHWRRGDWSVCRRGRPLVGATPQQQQAVVHRLHQLGPCTGLAVLQGEFPHLARAELQDLLRSFRQAWVGQHPRLLHVLHWQQPGRVWAMDYAEPPDWIDGRYPYILAVRDLGSGQQLLWLPLAEATAASTVAQLAWLFACYGAPLVLKSDNGSAFTAGLVQEFLQRWGVCPLFSPPRTPAYNGACEAAIGALKQRTAYQAERDGHAEQWSKNHLATARQQANETARPRGPKGPTPARAWQQRLPLHSAERQRFAATVRALESVVRQRQAWPLDTELKPHEASAVQREVLRRALVAHDYLVFTRRRIPIPIGRLKAAKIR
jgi:transposase InsO family protein